MQALKWQIGSKIRLKWTVPVFVDQTNLKIIWKFSLSQYRCHKTPIDVENCVRSALNSNQRKQNFTVILRIALAAKQIWVAVITIWGTLDSLPPWIWLSYSTKLYPTKPNFEKAGKETLTFSCSSKYQALETPYTFKDIKQFWQSFDAVSLRHKYR